MTGPIDRIIAALEAAGCSPRRSGDGRSSRCPAHDDRNPSLSINEGMDGCVLLKSHAGCELDGIVAALGLSKSDLFPDRMVRVTQAPRQEVAAEYNYTDERGALLFQSVRYEPKSFRQRRPVGDGAGTTT